MKKILMYKKLMLLPFAVVLLSFFTPIGATWAVPIEINTFLTNASFEGGVDGSGCPTGWVCTGSFGVYIPTSSQYTPGSDGLPGSLIVPDGTHAAYSPVTLAGSGTLSQSSTTATWVAGQQYTFTFWVGLPKTVQSDGLAASWPGTVRVMILSNGTTDNLSGSGPIQFDITSPGLGQWKQITETFTPGQNTGQKIGVEFWVSTATNHQVANFDIGTPAVPEPATLLLLGLGLIGLAGVRRKFKK